MAKSKSGCGTGCGVLVILALLGVAWQTATQYVSGFVIFLIILALGVIVLFSWLIKISMGGSSDKSGTKYSSGLCGLCGNTLARKSFTWHIRGQGYTVCAECNRTLRRKASNDATSGLG